MLSLLSLIPQLTACKMSTDLITYLNYMSTWDGESDDHIDSIITEFNYFVAMGSFAFGNAVNSIFDDIKTECLAVRDATIAEDALKISADAAAVAAIYSFGMGMVAYVALEAGAAIEAGNISSKSADLNNKLNNADANIGAAINSDVSNYITTYKANNIIIAAASPAGLDNRTCRSLLYQLLSQVKMQYNESLTVANFKKYTESARLLYNDDQISTIYDALDVYNLSGRTADDLSTVIHALTTFSPPTSIALRVVYAVTFTILKNKMEVADADLKAMAEEAGVPAEELEVSRFSQMDLVGKITAGIVVILSVVDIVLTIINIVDVVEQCNTQCESIDTIRTNYLSYYQTLSSASEQMNNILTSVGPQGAASTLPS